MKNAILAGAVIAVSMCLTSLAEEKDPIQAAVAHPDRPPSDQARDLNRKPAEVLAFFQIKPGMQVADMMAGGGYYTEMLSYLVGPKGKVYAQNNATALKRFADKAMTKKMAHLKTRNVVRLDRELEDPGLPEGQLDAVLMVLFYHDTYWMKVDRKAMNAAIFKSLKPGGVFGLIDHSAKADTRDRETQRLHRVDEKMVTEEILAAGFKLDGTDDLLRHPEDDRTVNVFKPEIRGKTDRFVLRFKKPAGS